MPGAVATVDHRLRPMLYSDYLNWGMPATAVDWKSDGFQLWSALDSHCTNPTVFWAERGAVSCPYVDCTVRDIWRDQ